MSREQSTVQEAQTAEPTSPQAEDKTYGLRPDLHAQIMQMSPADAEKLAEMLQLYPDFVGAILMVAAPHLGNAAVQRAIALAKSWKAKGKVDAASHDDMKGTLQDADDPSWYPEWKGTLDGEGDQPSETEPTSAPNKASGPEPAWVAGAHAYNAAHPALVDEFEELTNHAVLLDGENDPKAVARWQRDHGLDPDGKIGPHTIAVARQVKAKTSEVAAAPQTDARPPV
jgi:hypothetical protein